MRDYASALTRLGALGRFGVVPGLDAITRLCAALGDPQGAFPSLHIAGTNGKGSTAAMAESLLRSGGRRTGLYTSPHLVRFTERVRIDGAEIEPSLLAEALSRALDAGEALATSGARAATFFEVATAAAFLCLAEAGVEVAVIECGLGARWDATAVCRPFATVITSIGADHLEVLGPTLVDVAREKAGIARAGVPLLVGPLPDALAAVIDAEAARVAAPTLHLGGAIAVEPDAPDPGASAAGFVYRGPGGALSVPALPLRGRHQIDNAALALAAVHYAPGPPLGDPDRLRGLRDARWPGRLERLGPDLLVDGAHNPDGARALAEALGAPGARPPSVLLAGVLADKDVDGLLGPLLVGASVLVCTRPPSPRALSGAALAAHAVRIAPTLAVHVEDDPARALDRARVLAVAGGGGVVAFGSLILIGALRALVLQEAPDPVVLGDPRAGSAVADGAKIC